MNDSSRIDAIVSANIQRIAVALEAIAKKLDPEFLTQFERDRAVRKQRVDAKK